MIFLCYLSYFLELEDLIADCQRLIGRGVKEKSAWSFPQIVAHGKWEGVRPLVAEALIEDFCQHNLLKILCMPLLPIWQVCPLY